MQNPSCSTFDSQAITTADVLVNRGDGSFYPKSDFATGGGPGELAAADFNRDGRVDLAAAHLSSKVVSVDLNVEDRAPTDIALSNNVLPAGQAPGTAVGSFSTSDPDLSVSFTYALIEGAGSADNGLFAIDGSVLKAAAPLDSASRSTYSIRVRSTDAGGLYVEKAFSVVVLPCIFGSKSDYAVSDYPLSLAAADFNGGGQADLAVANYWGGTVSVLLNKGGGTFAPKVEYPMAGQPIAVVAADFNGDGKIDLAIGGTGSNIVSVLLGNGDGTFSARRNSAAAFPCASMAPADFNDDGKIDLAVANWWQSSTVSVLLNQGDGTFGPSVEYATGANPVSVTAADFNGDGKIDLAVANVDSNSVSILLGKGDGTFADKVDYAAGLNPRSLVAADFNRDGKLDLAAVNPISDRVSVLLNSGGGVFASRSEYRTNAYPLSMAAADLNGDGKLDLAVACALGNTLGVLLGEGDGTFAAGGNYAAGPYPAAVGAADFNGDGAADLAVANAFNKTVSVLQNKTMNGPVPNCVGMAIVSGKRSTAIQSGAPSAVRFQTVRLGKKGSIRVFRATNAGSRILKLGAVKLSRGFKVIGSLPKKLAPGKSAIFRVQFIGNRPGTWSGRIKLATSDPLRNPFVIVVVGRCIAPRRGRY